MKTIQQLEQEIADLQRYIGTLQVFFIEIVEAMNEEDLDIFRNKLNSLRNLN